MTPRSSPPRAARYRPRGPAGDRRRPAAGAADREPRRRRARLVGDGQVRSASRPTSPPTTRSAWSTAACCAPCLTRRPAAPCRRSSPPASASPRSRSRSASSRRCARATAHRELERLRRPPSQQRNPPHRRHKPREYSARCRGLHIELNPSPPLKHVSTGVADRGRFMHDDLDAGCCFGRAAVVAARSVGSTWVPLVEQRNTQPEAALSHGKRRRRPSFRLIHPKPFTPVRFRQAPWAWRSSRTSTTCYLSR